MTCLWRATSLAAVLALGLASSAFAQAPSRRPRRRATSAAAQSRSPGASNEPFGEDVTLTPKTIIT